MAIGAYLVYDGYAAHKPVGYLAAGIGYLVPMVALGVFGEQNTNDNLDCTIYHLPEACDRIAHPQFGQLLSAFFNPRELAITVGCYGLGWLVAKMTRRKPPATFVAAE